MSNANHFFGALTDSNVVRIIAGIERSQHSQEFLQKLGKFIYDAL